MIRIARSPRTPLTLTSEKITATLARLGGLERRRTTDFDNHWSADDVRFALWEMQHHKCVYCERTRELKYEPDVEHFRPKAGVTECGGQNGYWWLAYEWRNLFFSCRICNQKYKGNHFPLMEGSIRASQPDDALDEEVPLLIDPSVEDPEAHISWDWTRRRASTRYAFALGLTEKGFVTTKLLGLNHGELARERGRIVDILIQLIFDYKRMIDSGVDRRNHAFQSRKRLLLEELRPDRPFLALKRFILSAHGLDNVVKQNARKRHSSPANVSEDVVEHFFCYPSGG